MRHRSSRASFTGFTTRRRRTVRLLVAAMTTMGLAVLTAAPGASSTPARTGAPAAQASPPTVQVYGRANSFTGYPSTLPSGQNVQTNGVSGWQFPPGRLSWYAERAADGTILMAGFDHDKADVLHTGDNSVVSTYDTAANRFANVELSTSCAWVTASACTRTTSARTATGHPAGVSISDLQAIDDGAAVAFVTHAAGGQDVDQHGVWPAFGILTEGANGWQVARGPAGSDGEPTWENQWTDAQLNHASAAGAQACELGDHVIVGPEQSICDGFNEMAVLPQSDDVVITQYFGGESTPTDPRSAVAILDVTETDPGRYTTTVKASLSLPRIPNHTTADPADFFDLAPIAVDADPSSVAGDERFLLTFDIYPSGVAQPSVAIEYRYNSTTGALTPVSAPILPPDPPSGEGNFVGWVRGVYDHNGTLWMGRNVRCVFGAACEAGRMAVFPKVNGQRRLQSSTACRSDGTMADDTTSLSGKTVWGKQCRPEYDIVQPQAPFLLTRVIEDPPGGIVAVDQLGRMFAIRSSGSGTSMTFQVSNPVDTVPSRLPGAPTWREPLLGAVDPQHRMWFVASNQTERQASGGECYPPPFNCGPDPYQVLDQWLLSVDLDDLYSAPPVSLTGYNFVHAEGSRTISTHQRRPGTTADADVDSDAYYGLCATNPGCAQEAFFPNDGFMLMDDTGFGHLSGSVTYRVTVPTAGNFDITYYVGTHAATPDARIRAQVGSGATVDTRVSTPNGGWGYYTSDPVPFPAGTYDVTLSVPPGGGGWYLNLIIFRRVP